MAARLKAELKEKNVFSQTISPMRKLNITQTKYDFRDDQVS